MGPLDRVATGHRISHKHTKNRQIQQKVQISTGFYKHIE